jgi:ataxia telangiectasia mutated family protein
MGSLHRLKAHLTTGLQLGNEANAEELQLQLQLQWRLEEAKVLWSQGDQDTALHMATELEKVLKLKMENHGRSSPAPGAAVGSGINATVEQMRARVLRLCGKWMASTRSHCSQGVLDNYLRASANLLSGQLQEQVGEGTGESAGGKKKGERGRHGLRHLAKANMVLADYVAGLYENVKARVQSEEWAAGKQVAADREQELAVCESALREQKKQPLSGSKDEQAQQAERDKTLQRHTTVLKRECDQDAQERRRVEQSVQDFLVEALQQYGLALAYADTSDDFRAVFRLLSLWFNNSSIEQVNQTMFDHASNEGLITQVPSHKFVPLIYQIASRLGTSAASSDAGSRSATPVDGGGSRSSTPVVQIVSDHIGFQRALRKLLGRLAAEHPHHSIPQLLAFKNGEKVSGRGAEDYKLNVGDDKIEAAKEEIEVVKRRGADLKELVESMDLMFSAYIEMAMYDVRQFHNNKKNIPMSKLKLKSGIQFDHCLRDRSIRGGMRRVMPAVVTRSIRARPDCNYGKVTGGSKDGAAGTATEDEVRGGGGGGSSSSSSTDDELVRVQNFAPTFSLTDSGIHRPRIIVCNGSDGREYKQLVKGQDDVRQDLVIEQVFDTVNILLQRDVASRKRRLRLHTYKIVPLSPVAGVLEWVENTEPLGSYLYIGEKNKAAAHDRYRPWEWTNRQCREFMKQATDRKGKLKAFKEVCANFSPVFHHFFLERFRSPSLWFHRRTNYTRSVAVNSIVGHVMGIGDRHSQNILIHHETAELVHIDFGVTFDQGKALATPETVPFRLTRDLVDGMGVAGTNGVFIRCCEETMRVLRANRASLLTILEV